MQMICRYPLHPKIKGEGHFEPSCQYSPPSAPLPPRAEINNDIKHLFTVTPQLWDQQGLLPQMQQEPTNNRNSFFAES